MKFALDPDLAEEEREEGEESEAEEDGLIRSLTGGGLMDYRLKMH